ncbi:hypothetical protein GCM10009664_61600 [Kitasatospora gansuensis]
MSATVRPPEAVLRTIELPGAGWGLGVLEAGGAGFGVLGRLVGGAGGGGSLLADGLGAGWGGRDGDGYGDGLGLGVGELLTGGELGFGSGELVQEVSSAVASSAVRAKRVRMATTPDVVPAARAGRLLDGTSGAYGPVPKMYANERDPRTGTSVRPCRPGATRPGG